MNPIIILQFNQEFLQFAAIKFNNLNKLQVKWLILLYFQIIGPLYNKLNEKLLDPRGIFIIQTFE